MGVFAAHSSCLLSLRSAWAPWPGSDVAARSAFHVRIFLAKAKMACSQAACTNQWLAAMPRALAFTQNLLEALTQSVGVWHGKPLRVAPSCGTECDFVQRIRYLQMVSQSHADQ